MKRKAIYAEGNADYRICSINGTDLWVLQSRGIGKGTKREKVDGTEQAHYDPWQSRKPATFDHAKALLAAHNVGIQRGQGVLNAVGQ